MNKLDYLYRAFSCLALASLTLYLGTQAFISWEDHKVFMQSVEVCDVKG